jgi:uncharacterized protein (TIGR02996 family)
MNEEEAFIRAIVDGPGDDLPRLVYADWLDDRADPRGAYLRAEMEWAKPWRGGECPADSLQLGELAAKLDLEWVARVSRPPMGVCCEHLWPEAAVDGGFRRVEAYEVDQLQTRIGATLPAEYRGFLLNYNGGFPEPGTFAVPGLGRDGQGRVALDIFLAVRDSYRLDYIGHIFDSHAHDRTIVDARGAVETVRARVLLIGCADIVTLLLGLTDPVRGYVFGENDSWKSDGLLYSVAPSLPILLAMMRPYTSPWERLIIRGETTAFRAWVSTPGNMNAVERWRTPLSLAIRYEQPAIIELLLELGAQPAWHDWEAARYSRNASVRDIVLLRYPTRPQ